LAAQEAEQFLLQRIEAKREEQDAPERCAAAELAQELGCLPLALEQAAAYCEQSSFTLADYLRLFHERRLELFSPETLGGDQDGNEMITVTTTWNLSLDRFATTKTAPKRQPCSHSARSLVRIGYRSKWSVRARIICPHRSPPPRLTI